MEPARSLMVHVVSDRDASLSTTWSQRSNTQWHGQIDADQHHDAGTSYDLPEGCDLDAVADAIKHVLTHHDALRSVFSTENGVLGQVIERSGEVTINVFETGADEAEKAVSAAIGHVSADPWNGRQWPIRWAVVVAESPLFLVVAYNRLILDAHSAGAVVHEVLKACSGEASELSPHWQVTEEARYQVSPEGVAASARSVAHWRDILLVSPPSLFDYPTRPYGETRYVMASIESPAAARAVQMMRKRFRVTGATLLLSAAAIVLGRYTDHSEVVMQMITANRGDRNRRHMVGSLTSQGLLRLEVGDRPFGEIARQAFRASSAAHRSGYYDPDAVLALRAEVGLLRGASLDLGAYFNDRRTAQDTAELEPEVTERELRELAVRGDLTDASAVHAPPVWKGSQQTWAVSPTMKDARFLLMTHHAPTMPVSLFCDMKYIPLEATQQMLGGMERVLIAAACAELDALELGRVSGVEPVSRGSSWVRCDGGWCDLTVAAGLWRKVTGTDQCAVVAEKPADGGGCTLVGYVVAADAAQPSLSGLHAAFVTALARRNDVRAPHVYRLVAAAPADLADVAAWRRAPVLAESDGRP